MEHRLSCLWLMLGLWISHVYHFVACQRPMVTVLQPVNHQKISENQTLQIEYSIASFEGAQPNYPQSLDVVLQYSQVQNHISNTYQLVAKTELATEPDKKGKHDQKYATKWKLPDCQFFQEHSPASWEYALVFVPYYEPPPRRKNRKQRKDPPTDKGPQQDPIEVKLDFQWAHGAPSC